MSTFGEIVEPVSRAAWEDWDDITSEPTNTSMTWKNAPEKLELKTLLIFEGKYLADIIKGQDCEKLHLINYVTQPDIKFYNIVDTDRYVCILKDYDLIHSSEIVELLRPYITAAKDVISLQTKSLNEYKTTENINCNCVMRILRTNISQKSPETEFNYHKLEQPNIIAGVSAGVITLRDHLDMSGIAIVCYMEYPEEYDIDEVGELLIRLNITPNISSRPHTILDTNLYL